MTGQQGEFHKGIDLGLPKGSPVYAVQGGEIIQSGNYGTAGEMIAVKTSDGHIVRYLHMDNGSRQFKAGDKINKGTVLGRVGSTGESTGPHLHIDVADSKGNYINPTYFV